MASFRFMNLGDCSGPPRARNLGTNAEKTGLVPLSTSSISLSPTRYSVLFPLLWLPFVGIAHPLSCPFLLYVSHLILQTRILGTRQKLRRFSSPTSSPPRPYLVHDRRELPSDLILATQSFVTLKSADLAESNSILRPVFQSSYFP